MTVGPPALSALGDRHKFNRLFSGYFGIGIEFTADLWYNNTDDK